jgi:hypothetical protein
MKEFFKSFLSVLYFISIVIGGTILCLVGVIPILLILLLVSFCVLLFLIFIFPLAVIDGIIKCVLIIKGKINDEECKNLDKK